MRCGVVRSNGDGGSKIRGSKCSLFLEVRLWGIQGKVAWGWREGIAINNVLGTGARPFLCLYSIYKILALVSSV